VASSIEFQCAWLEVTVFYSALLRYFRHWCGLPVFFRCNRTAKTAAKKNDTAALPCRSRVFTTCAALLGSYNFRGIPN
jgi:hypothetical protein